MQKVWQQKFKFERLGKRQLRLLGSQLPLVSAYEESVLLSKSLPRQVEGGLEAVWSGGAGAGAGKQLHPDGSESELVVEQLKVDAPAATTTASRS